MLTLVGTPDPEPVPRAVVFGVNVVETANVAFTGAVMVSPLTDTLGSYTTVGWRWTGDV